MSPSLKNRAYNALNAADALISKALLTVHEKRGSVVTLFFHMLFEDEAEIKSDVVYPQEAVTVGQFRQIVLYFLKHGYQITNPDEMAAGLSPNKKYLHLTFDDGYFNNSRALPILKELGGSVTVFVSTDHSRLNRCIWSDVVYRVVKNKGWDLLQLDAYCSRLNVQKTSVIEAKVQNDFPEANFTPLGDLDRMFTPAELKEYSGTGKFYFENHTRYHAVLQDYSRAEMLEEIGSAQQFLFETTGRMPVAIGYPNGIFNTTAGEVAQEQGLKLGFVCDRRKEYVSTLQQRPMQLGRFALNGRKPLLPQLVRVRSDLMLVERIRKVIR